MRRNARRKCEIFHEKNNFSIAIRFPSAFGICLASFVGFVQGSCVEVLCLELCSAKSEFELVGIYHGIYMDAKSGASELSRREANSEARSSASRSSLSLFVARRQNSFFFCWRVSLRGGSIIFFKRQRKKGVVKKEIQRHQDK